ncbi:MAG TPA: extracellular solute-binding protein [Candidatus Eisenbacteria bacterium]|nr:extracellular solute-binding protein [Candidatus Eisenbacteria bacterium]
MGATGHRRVATLALAALLLVSLAGCGKKREPNVIVFWQFSPLTAIQPVLARFEAENPGWKVQVEQLTWQSGREKIVTAVAAGRPPDLCELGSTFLPGLVADSTLLDLSDRADLLRDKLVGWEIATYRGRAYAYPWMLGTRALFLNDDLFRQAGLDPSKPPETWAELLHAAKTITERVPGAKGFGMNAGEREILFKKFMPFAWGNGGDILDSTMTVSVMASPANVAALRFYLSLKPYSLLDRQEMHEQAFGKGRLGMVISGPWLLRALAETAPGLHASVALMPRPAAGRGTHASFAGAEVLGIFRRATHPGEARKLAEFLVRPENTMPIFLATGNAFPAAVGTEADSHFVAHASDRLFLEQIRTAVAPPLHPQWVEIEEIVNAELEEAIYGTKTPEAALADADARITAALKREAIARP